MSKKTVTVLYEMIYQENGGLYRTLKTNLYTTYKKASAVMWEDFESRKGYDLSKINPNKVYASIDYTCRNNLGQECFYRVVVEKKEVY